MSRRWTPRDRGRLLCPRLSAPARPRRDRLLGADRRPPHAGAASRDRGNHPVRARRQRRAPADRQGRGPPAGRRGQRLPLSRSRTGAPCSRPRRRRPASAPRCGPARRASPEPGRARAAGRRFGERDLAGRARPPRPLARDAPRAGRQAQHHARRPPARRGRARLPARPAATTRGTPKGAPCRCSTIPGPACGRTSSGSRRAARRSPSSPTRASSSSRWPRGSSRCSSQREAPCCAQGEALIADRSGVAGWRNLGDREAVVFWILHDEHGV